MRAPPLPRNGWRWAIAAGPRLGLATLAALAVGPAEASPLPPPRPSDLGTPRQAEPESPVGRGVPEPAQDAAQPALDGTGCEAELVRQGYSLAAPAMPRSDNPACRIDGAVRLVALKTGREPAIAFPDRPIIACTLAASLGRWLGGIAAPVLSKAVGSPLSAIRTGPGFECRARNRLQGAKLSAHAQGQAIDIAGYDFGDGRRLSVARPDPAREDVAAALMAVRIAACGWFTTVLGPGSDAFHTDHLHLDIQQHGSSDRYRICQ